MAPKKTTKAKTHSSKTSGGRPETSSDKQALTSERTEPILDATVDELEKGPDFQPAGTLPAPVASVDTAVETGAEDDPRFRRLDQAAKELTEGKVSAQLGRTANAFVIPPKGNWATDKKHLIVNMALGQCQDTRNTERYWPLIKKLRGSSIGNSSLEIKHLVSLVLLEVLFKELDAGT